MGVEKIKTGLKGLYLVPPHGELIARGEKTAIAKSKDCGLQGEWILVSGRSAYGTMKLGEPVEVSLEDFDKQFEQHHVSEAERWRWWPNQEKLWLYPVTKFTPYEGVKSMVVPPGVQTVMQDVTFDTQSRNGEDDKGIDATQFVLAHRAWEDENIAAEVWDLFIGDDDRNYWHVVLADDPLTESSIAAQPASGATITDTGGEPHSVFGLAINDTVNVEPGSKFNPTETPCKLAILDAGKAQTLLDEEGQREYNFDGEKLEGDWRLQVEDESKLEGFWLMSKGEQSKVPEVPETEEAAMPWTVADPPNPAKNWTESEKEKCVEAANAVLREEGTEQDAIFACIRAAGKTERPGGEEKKSMQEVTVLIDDEQTEVEQDDKAQWTTAYINTLPDTAFLLIESGGEKKDGITRPLSLRHLPVRGKNGEIDLPHLRNAIARAPQLKDKDGKRFSKTAIEKAQDKARKLLAEAQKAQGMEEARLADGGANYCICPTCKRLAEHERGKPCNEIKCEECDVMLQGATGAEVEAAGVQGEQAEVAAAAAGVDAAVKTGKRVRKDRVAALDKLKKELEDFLSAFKEFFGWATYEDAEKQDTSPSLSNWLSTTGKKALTDHGSAAFAFKALDGTPWWMQWTTNAFRDREQEIFTTKSIADFVDRHTDEETKGEFWYRHIPGTKFGDVRWQAMEGRFLVQAGPFDDSPIGTAFKEFFGQYPTGHPVVAPEGWGTSHGYAYDRQDREDGIYNWFEIKESTVLPLRVASNPWNPMPQILEVKSMNEQEKKDLEAIGGKDLVNDVLNAGQAKTKELEEAGIAYKETSEKPAPEEDKKAGDMAKLIGKVEEIAGSMEGETSEALKAICAEMKAAYEDMESEPEADEKEAESKPEPEATKEAPLTRAEVGAGMQALLGAVREEIKATSETTVQTLMDQLKPIIEELQKPMPEPKPAPVSEPEAVKESLTPAASLADLFASVRASKEARIRPDSELAQKGPKETMPTAPSVTGVTLVDHFIASTDQGIRQ